MVRFLCLALLLVCVPPALGAEPPSMKSILLVARKDLPDPFFRESVVLITPSPVGPPIGVIVNRPTQILLSRVFPDIEGLRALDEKLFFGGPVRREQLVAVFRAAKPPEGALEVFDGIYMSSNRELFRELLGRENPVEGLRIFAGYAGWAPGQLEAEVARGDWHLATADSGLVLGSRPEGLWKELERRASARKTFLKGFPGAGRAPGSAFPRAHRASDRRFARGAQPRW